MTHIISFELFFLLLKDIFKILIDICNRLQHNGLVERHKLRTQVPKEYCYSKMRSELSYGRIEVVSLVIQPSNRHSIVSKEIII